MRTMEDSSGLTYVLAPTSKRLHACNPTSKRQGEQPHAHRMQMRVYILHVYFIYISNAVPFLQRTILKSCHVADCVAP